MKKFLSIFIVSILALSVLAFVGCGKDAKKVNFKYYEDGSLVKTGLASGAEEIGMLPEPAATLLENQTPNTTWYRLDVQELYDSEAKAYPQAVLMVKSSLLNAHPELVTYISGKISDNVNWAKQNATDAISAVKGVYPSTTLLAPMFSEKAIDGCKIYFQSAEDAKTSVQNYINDIRGINQNSANAVGDDFFYTPSSASGEWQSSEISFYAPDGAPAISIAKFICDNDDFGTGKTVNYNVVDAGSIVSKMAQSTADIILMPINGASKMYKASNNASNPYKLVSVITHGNFYIMSKTKLTLNDLVGKKIAVPNMGAVPDWTLRVILQKNGLEIKVVD